MTSRRETRQSKYEIDFLRLHLSVQWNTLLLPFEQHKFTTLLPDEGYALDEQLRQIPSFGSYPEVSGTIARKGSTTSVSMDTRKPTLGLEAQNGSALVEEFEIIEGTLRDGLSFDSPAYASFYEVLANALVWTKQDALAVLRKLSTGELIASRFSEKTGLGPAVNVSLRLVPVSGEIHSGDWWDMHIEPSFRSPHQCYRVQVVYRKPQRDEVMRVAKDIEKIIRDSISVLEESDE